MPGDASSASSPHVPTFDDADVLPRPGEKLGGKYTIVSRLAEGGMGIVYEAHHDELDDRVAIKVLKPEVAKTSSEDIVGRFKREARTVAKIRSEHVVRIYDVDTSPTGLSYFVMEFLVGRDLEQILKSEGPLAVSRAVDAVLEACEALAEAHGLGIIHRDLKPANLFVHARPGDAECVKVVDFGISKISAGDGAMSMTRTQSVFGSPFYMSPEQMRASRDVDARSDVWSVGIILHELLTGSVPFPGETMTQVCAGILQDDPPSIRAARADVPPALEAAIHRCIAKSPAERHPDIASLALAIAPYGSPTASARSLERIGRSSAKRAGSQTSVPLVTSVVPSVGSSPGSNAGSSPSSPGAVAGAFTTTAWGQGKESIPGVAKRSKLLVPIVVASLIVGAVVAFGVVSRSSRFASPAPVAPPSAVIPVATSSALPAGTTDPSSPATTAATAPPTSLASAPTTKIAAPPVPSLRGGAPKGAGPAVPASSAKGTNPPTKPADLWDGRK